MGAGIWSGRRADGAYATIWWHQGLQQWAVNRRSGFGGGSWYPVADVDAAVASLVADGFEGRWFP